MSNVSSEDNKQQVIAIGRLGWSLRRIENATSVSPETAAERALLWIVEAPSIKFAGLQLRTFRSDQNLAR